MKLPLTITDISVVVIVGAVALLVTVALTSPYFGLTNLIINKKRLRNVANFMQILFLAIIITKMVSMFTGP